MSHPLSLHPIEKRNTPKRVKLSAFFSRAILTSNRSYKTSDRLPKTLKPRFSSLSPAFSTPKNPKTCFMHKSHRAS